MRKVATEMSLVKGNKGGIWAQRVTWKREEGLGVPGESNSKVSEARRGTGHQELPVIACGWGLGCFRGNQRNRDQIIKGLTSPAMEVELYLRTLFMSQSIKCQAGKCCRGWIIQSLGRQVTQETLLQVKWKVTESCTQVSDTVMFILERLLRELEHMPRIIKGSEEERNQLASNTYVHLALSSAL